MIAKTQSKVAQFEVKQRLRRLLNKRSAEFSTMSKDDLEELDLKIRHAREFLQSNKLNLPARKKKVRE